MAWFLVLNTFVHDQVINPTPLKIKIFVYFLFGYHQFWININSYCFMWPAKNISSFVICAFKQVINKPQIKSKWICYANWILAKIILNKLCSEIYIKRIFTSCAGSNRYRKIDLPFQECWCHSFVKLASRYWELISHNIVVHDNLLQNCPNLICPWETLEFLTYWW